MNNQSTIAQRTNVLTVALCVLGTFCEGMDLQAAGVAAGGIGAEFKPLAGQMGNFFSASTLGLFFGAMIGGKLSDRFGRKNSLIISVVLFGLFSWLTAQAWDMTSLIWARLLTGLGLGGAMPNLIALVAESSGEHRRSANVALAYGGTPLGGALVSWISLVSEPAQWRWIFIAGGIVPLVVAAIMIRYLQESDTFTSARSAVAAQPHAVGVIHPGSFLAVVGEGRALRSTVLWIAFFIGLVVMYLLLNWLPTLMTGNGLSPAQAAAAQIGFNVGGALAAVGAGHLFEGVGRRPTVVVAAIALPLLLAWLANAPAQVMLVSIIIMLIGCAIMAVHAFLYAAAPACYPTLIRGAGVGLAVAIGRIGSIVGPKWGGMLKDAGYSSSHFLMSIVPIALLAAVAAIILLWMVPRVANGSVNSVTH
jgi:AAHS family 3-hydroxyphenylpropionic acid transporter